MRAASGLFGCCILTGTCRLLVQREVVLYCDFHGHSRKNNVFVYGCHGGRGGSEARLRERVFPLMLSKNAPDKVGLVSGHLRRAASR